MKVKICGITSPGDARMVVDTGVDYVGVIFFEGSPRHVSPHAAEEISSVISRNQAHMVGVFVDRPVEEVASLVASLGLDMVQVHGMMVDDDYVRRIRQVAHVPVLRRQQVRSAAGVKKALASPADYVLIDSAAQALVGRQEKRLDLSILKGAPLDRVFLAGAISPDNVAEAVALNPFAIDVTAGVESSPGRKDADKVRLLFERIAAAGRPAH